MENFDFCGWATRNDIQCSDGRTIRKGAFQHQDGVTVPLVWNHDHKDPLNVLGHALLENRDNGVYAYCTFNDTPQGENAKSLVKHGDVTALSIYANKLRQNGGDVVHGVIRELSLVLAGANPGAYIETVMAHSDDSDEEVVIYTGEQLQLAHAEEETGPEVKEEPVAEEAPAKEKEDPELEHADDGEGEAEMAEKTVKEVFDTLNEEQKKVVYAMIGAAVEEAQNEQGDAKMKHNAFENEMEETNTLSHAEMLDIVKDAKRLGSMRDAFLEHGITDVGYLFPDNKNLTNTPTFINNEPFDWVKVVMNGVKHTPFSRVKMMFADIREDEARALGYIKGNLKKEEVFTLLKRVINPTTIYKLQKMDRDDVVDITDFEVVAWIKGEMRLKLDEELARAILFGDGRLTSSNDHINATCIIPACSDAALYTVTKEVKAESGESDPHAMIRSVVEAMDDFRGGSNTVAFLKQKDITKMLLMEDAMGHRLYKTVQDIADAMTVGKIVKVPANIVPTGFHGVILDLGDYNVGADKGGAVNMFDDFDINYNKYEYLIETRCSGGLTKPFSAIALKEASE